MKIVMRLGQLSLWLVLGTALVNCGGGNPTSPIQPTPPPAPPPAPPPPPPGSVKTIELAYPTALLARGQALQVAATLRDSVGNVLTGRSLAWSSQNTAVVRVDATGATGNLTAATVGTATVTGTIDGVSASSAVIVTAFSSVRAGTAVSCAITTDGRLFCAGGTYGTSAQPVARSLRFSAMDTNGFGATSQACALTTDGVAYCWGDNQSGQLGVGDIASRSDPTPVAGNLHFAAISVGRDYACGLTTGGDAWCWGNGIDGELGAGDNSSSFVPVAVQGGLKFTQLEAGSGTTCGLSTTARAWCWGRNDLGQLGIGSGGQLGDVSLVPVPVGNPLASVDLKQVVTRGPKTCALTSPGKAYCWGNNTVDELGAVVAASCFGSKPCSLAPVAVNTSATFASLAAAQFGNCGLTSSGDTFCWGMDNENWFGAASGAVPQCTTPGAAYGCTATPVSGPSGLVSLSGSVSTSCGMKLDGVAYCWGGNASGQRGWAGSSPDPIPRPFSINPGANP